MIVMTKMIYAFCVCVCSTCFKIYTNLPCGKSMYIYRKRAPKRTQIDFYPSREFLLYFRD